MLSGVTGQIQGMTRSTSFKQTLIFDHREAADSKQSEYASDLYPFSAIMKQIPIAEVIRNHRHLLNGTFYGLRGDFLTATSAPAFKSSAAQRAAEEIFLG
ncbi:hypothetical protein Mal35_01660 [Gimesia maris]|nr:hypothetical protein Mal35_01660 [Gimesia maris]